jgi:2-polyprenyl-6-methoxyphenol hydroxylase-like FAD-dependent oxidoreductase
LICGTGVGGLSAGLALKRAGFDVVVFERHPELRTAGVGLNVWPNGVRVLYDLGLADEFNRTANLLESYKTYSSDGELVGDEDLVAYRERYGAPVTGVYRRDLNAMLARALGDEHLRFGHELTGVEQTGDEVICTFANGERATGDFLVAADGVYSVVRTQLFGEKEFRPDEHVRWRGVFDVQDAGVDPHAEVDVIGPDGHLGWLPIGRGLAYWYAAGHGLVEKAQALEYFGSWTATPVPAVLAATQDETVIRNELMDLAVPLDRWTQGRVTLLGDAAHPMLPGVAQGANQALQDTAALVAELTSGADVERALSAYESARIGTATRVVEISRSLFDYDAKLGELEEVRNNPIFSRYADVVEGARAA